MTHRSSRDRSYLLFIFYDIIYGFSNLFDLFDSHLYHLKVIYWLPDTGENSPERRPSYTFTVLCFNDTVMPQSYFEFKTEMVNVAAVSFFFEIVSLIRGPHLRGFSFKSSRASH